MKPVLPVSTTSRRALYLLGLLAALKAAGLVLIAQAVATGIASLAAGAVDWTGLLVEGILGAILRSLAVWGQESTAQRAAAGVKEELRSALTTRVMDDGGKAAGMGTGALSVLLTRGLDGLDNYYTKYLPALVMCAVVPLLIGARILFADWISAVVVVLTVPLVPVFMILIGLHTQDKVREASASLDRLSDHLLELARGLPVLVGLGRAGAQTRALRDVAEEYRSRTMETLKVAFLSSLALELIATISVAVVAVFIGIRLLNGDMGLELGLLALILAPECYQPLRDLGAAHHASEDGLDALERTRQVTDAPPVRRLVPDGSGEHQRGRDLTVRGLSIGYESRDGNVVENLDFTVPAGTITALSGPSGSGKTSVLKVLAGLRGDGSGSRISGTITGADRGSIAWIPQHPVLTAPTVVEEIGLYSGLAGGQERHDAAVRALDKLHSAGLLDIPTGELSPGELRRVAVARALARLENTDAYLLLADEPTAHLDDSSARAIESALAALRGRITMVLIAHNPATAALADQVIPVGVDLPVEHTFHNLAHAGNGGFTQPITDSTWSSSSAVGSIDNKTSAVGPSSNLPETPDPAPAPKQPLLRNLAMLRPWSRQFIAALLFGTGAALFAVALAALSGWLIVRASEQPPILYLLTAIVGVRFFGIGRSVFRYWERLRLHDAVFRSTNALRLRLWNGLLEHPAAWRKLARGGGVLEKLVGDVDELRDLAPRAVFTPLVGVATAAVSCAVTAVAVPAGLPWQLLLSAVCLFAAPALALTADRAARRATVEVKANMLNASSRMLAAAEDLTANAVANTVRADVGKLDAALTSRLQRSAWAQGLANALTALACSLSALAMLGAAGNVPAGVAAVVVLMQLALIEPFTAVNTAAQQLAAWRAVGERVLPELGSAGVRSDNAPRNVHADQNGQASWEGTLSTAPAPDKVLELRDAGYSYPGQESPIFSSLSLELPRGRWLAVTGPSGSGKSTLLGVLLGFLPLDHGSYLTANVSADSAVSAGTIPRIAWCPQEAHLFNSSIRANLVLARSAGDPPSEAEIQAALDSVGLGGFVRGLPDGTATSIGPGGTWLSGGQRQRLAVARALLTEADIVLLDEPTAHLDRESAGQLLTDLRRGLAGKSVVMVTHNPEDAAVCDDLLELLQGAESEDTESGTKAGNTEAGATSDEEFDDAGTSKMEPQFDRV
ncbi:thiol reductant ABC exporter subunit CydD [Arthrobacter sp. H14]|uniref:thiol reductant ABC exporter subunit CydD n=1 Tax=Arthrobacter sp. H14 TaxID=1312959 RepID=UPI0004AFEF02|nr:thiol reductant ABC exporter subunit CydD [Arthrobacter sp. H14]